MCWPAAPTQLTMSEELQLRTLYDESSESFLLFRRLVPYFRGRHHIEEIMWRENISRETVEAILTEYRQVLVVIQHEENEH